jgi:hypothetical protein
MIAAERATRGGTIVEPTSGNTGVGLAIVAAQRGYKCVFVMTDKVAPEKIAFLRAYGAEVVVCPVAVAPEDPQSYYSTAERLVREIPGAFRPNQYANPANPQAHVESTGPEIWRQTAGRSPISSRDWARAASPASAATCRKIPGCRSSRRPRRPVYWVGRGGHTWSRASVKTSGPRPTTRRSSTVPSL